MSTEPKEALISYSRRDLAVVEDIVIRLQRKGCTVWFDKWEIIPGDDWQQHMQDAVNHCGCCAVFFGTAEPDGWQNPEMQLALNRSKNDKSKKFTVIPVLLDTENHEAMKGYLSSSFAGLSSWVDFKHPDPGYPLHLLYCGIKRIRPGKYPPDDPADRREGGADPIRDLLLKAAQYRKDNVIDEEGYRTFRDKIFERTLDLPQVTIHE